MNTAQQLDALQALDLDLDRLRGQLATVQGSQGEPPTIPAARETLAQADLLLTKRRKSAQDREWDVRDGQAKVNNVESRLYGGVVTNPKELASLLREVESLKAHLSILQDRSLETMVAQDEAQSAVNAARASLAELEAAWEADLLRLRGEEQTLQNQIAAKEARRQAEAALIDPASLAIYQQLRPTKGGRAVARLRGDMCEGCRLTLPSGQAARAKTSLALVYCINCGRILCK
jgi:predicted  nucleic acid-binding Zn-ribbon protein